MVITKLYTVRSVRTAYRIDYWGGVGLVWCLVPLLLVAEQGREWGWASPAALACYTAGLLGLGFFLAVEHAMGENALIPFSLFRIGAFAQVNVVNFLGGVGAFTALASSRCIFRSSRACRRPPPVCYCCPSRWPRPSAPSSAAQCSPAASTTDSCWGRVWGS